MSVQQLPQNLVEKVRTGITLNSLPAAVAELLANSLDAGAKNICVKLNAASLSFEVEDDGHGIQAGDLNNLGCRYCTSKIRSLDDFNNGVRTLGFRGEAISSIFSVAAEVCITTRARGTFVTSYKQVHSGGTSVRTGPSAQHLTRSGTVISVKRFLFNQPVRQRQLAIRHRYMEQGKTPNL